MNYEVNFEDGYANVKVEVEVYNIDMTAKEAVGFINAEAAACKMELVEMYTDDWGESTEEIIYIWFFNADKTKTACVTVNNEDENYYFWEELAKKGATIEGFAISAEGEAWDKVLKVEKLKVTN